MKSVLKLTLKGTAFKVLLVEDKIAVAELIQELLLEAKGVRASITRVQRVSEAIEALNQESFDAILLDFSIPDGKGLDTISRFKEYVCKGNSYVCPAIIVLSAIDDEELALGAIYAGAQDYLVKGKIESELLIRSLHYAIARQRMQGALKSNEEKCHCVIDDNVQEAIFPTSLKQAEETLRESERKFRAVFDSTLDAILIADDDGYYIDANPAACALLGLPKEQIIGSHLFMFTEKDQVQNTQNLWQQFLAQDQMRGEFRLHLSDGTTRDIEYSAKANFLPGRHLSVFRDVTERKLAESALRQQKEVLQTIFDHIPLMVTFYDPKGQLQLINRELERVLGWSIAELGNRDMLAFCYPNPKQRQRVVEHMQTATGKWQDFKTRTRDGCVVDTSWANIRLSDGTTIGIGSDVTERKRAEEALRALTHQERKRALQLERALNELQQTQAQLVQNEKMASLGQLVAGIAHEINNPTSFIYGNVTPALQYTSDLLHLIALYQQHYPHPSGKIQDKIEALDLDFIKQDFPKLLRSMQEGALRIRGIILSLRQFSRLDEAEQKKADLHQGIDSTLMILQNRLKEKANRTAIQVIKEYGDLPWVECYHSELNQVFMNILSNAIDALEERMKEDSSFIPQIWICTEVLRVKTQQSTDRVVIRIADNGPGISPRVQQRVFDPFFTTKPVGKGTGLGLSISHSIVVKKHKGALYFNSQFGQGTEFVIELPLR